MPGRTNPNFMNGVPELLVLSLLEEREMYGYELVAAIREATGQAISLGEGVVYPALHDLEGRGFLASRERTVEGRKRVYYRLTAKGRRRRRAVVDDWSRITSAVVGVVGGHLHVDPAV